MKWIDLPQSSISAILPSSFRGMALAFIPISASAAFGVIADCRDRLAGRAHEKTSDVTGTRTWVHEGAVESRIILLFADGQFYVGTRTQHPEADRAA